ncbi:MAG: winged helix-turn-helix transcriptional regulator, partial [Thermoplasmata archaeon]
AFAFPVSAQGEVIVQVDQEFQIADLTVDEAITIHLTGNFIINDYAGRAYFGIYAPEGWETSISPEEWRVTPGETISFEGEVKPSADASQEEHDIYVWASIDNNNPSPGDIISSTPSVFRDISIVEVIKNRIKLLSDIPEHRVLPDSTITLTFEVTNVATVTDTFFIELVGDEALKDQGWNITQSDEELTLEPGESREFYVEEQIPSDAPVGDYKFEVVVSSLGHGVSGSSQTMITKVRLPIISEPFWTLGLVLMVAFVGTGIGLAFFFAATQYGYLALLSLFLPLYVRLKKKDVLSHFTRGQIFGYIQANPGAHYNAIIQNLGLHNGVGAYHLQVLAREGFIKSARDGIYKRFYPSNMRIPEKRLHLSRVQKDILGVIQKHPGVTQKQVSKLLDESKQVVNYNVKVLETAGLIRVERLGRGTACFAGNVRYVPDEDIYELAEDKGTAPVMQV